MEDLSTLSNYVPQKTKEDTQENSNIVISEKDLQEIKDDINNQRIVLLLSGCLY